ncbi:MAG TPA: amidohydrolase family protein [Candidatus Polarisedimenticolia bacterium]|nr:amidohydrolase family protein [Candidatus Polarisedimenticolia bacterium]
MTASRMIVDSHVHLLPERLAAKIRQFFVERSAPPLPYPYAPGAARQALVRAGVSRCWSLPYAHRGGVASPLNRWMAQAFPGDPFVVPGATVHPDDDVEQVVSEAIATLGLTVFKLHCSVGRFAADDRRLDPLWRRVSKTAAPVVLHAGSAHEGTATDEEMDAVVRTAARWPDAVIIVAHFGWPAAERTLELLSRSRSVCADLTPVVADPVSLARSAIAGLERRILFGSDTPTVAIPIEQSIARVRAWRLPPEQEAAVLGGNAGRLLGAARDLAPRGARP